MGGHTWGYDDKNRRRPQPHDPSRWEIGDDDDPDLDRSASTHTCRACEEWQTTLSTPKIRTTSYCRDCDDFQKFVRSDKFHENNE